MVDNLVLHYLRSQAVQLAICYCCEGNCNWQIELVWDFANTVYIFAYTCLDKMCSRRCAAVVLIFYSAP